MTKSKVLPRDNLKNYKEVDHGFFNDIYKEYGNKNDHLKIVENTKGAARYYIWKKLLDGKLKKK